MAKQANKRILWLTQLALLTAITIVLQMLATAVRFGPFQINLALTVVIVGAAVLGIGEGIWLGAVSAAVILLNGDAAAFLAFSVPGTILTVIGKGVGAGAAAGAVYKALEKKNQFLAALAAAVTAPVVNTGIFALCCYAFFIPLLTEWAGGKPVTSYIFLTMIGLNFLIELASNVVLSSMVVRITRLLKNRRWK